MNAFTCRMHAFACIPYEGAFTCIPLHSIMTHSCALQSIQDAFTRILISLHSAAFRVCAFMYILMHCIALYHIRVHGDLLHSHALQVHNSAFLCIACLPLSPSTPPPSSFSRLLAPFSSALDSCSNLTLPAVPPPYLMAAARSLCSALVSGELARSNSFFSAVWSASLRYTVHPC